MKQKDVHLYRQKQIIEILLEEEDYLAVSKIAEKMGLSSRTIRNELRQIKPLVEKMELDLEIKSGNGLLLHADPSRRLAARSYLNQGFFSAKRNFAYHPKDRQQYMMLRILTGEPPVKLEDLQQELFISRASAYNDLHQAQETLQSYKISIQRFSSDGIRVKGKERHIRTCLVDLLSSSDDEERFSKLFRHQAVDPGPLFPVLQMDARYLANYLRMLNTKPNLFSTDISITAKMRAILLLLISVKRYQTGHEVKLSDELMQELKAAHAVSSTEFITEPIETYYHTSLSEVEKRYLQVFFLTLEGKYFSTKSDRIAARRQAQKFVKEWSKALSIDLSQDAVLLEDLERRILKTKAKYMFGIHSEFSQANEVFLEYQEYFALVKKSLKTYEEEHGYQTSEEEVYDLLLVLIASLKRQVSDLKVLLFCPSETSLIALLKEELKQNVQGLHIDFARNESQLIDRDLDSYDLLLTTSPIEWTGRGPVLLINPILRKKDLGRLQEILFQLRRQKLPRV